MKLIDKDREVTQEQRVTGNICGIRVTSIELSKRDFNDILELEDCQIRLLLESMAIRFKRQHQLKT